MKLFKKPLMRDPYTPFEKPTIDASKDGLTKQSFKDDCDMNIIVRKYQQSGFVDHINRQNPNFGIAPNSDFYQTQLAIANVKSLYENLSDVSRGRFASVSDLMEALIDPARITELTDLGIFQETEPQLLPLAPNSPDDVSTESKSTPEDPDAPAAKSTATEKT